MNKPKAKTLIYRMVHYQNLDKLLTYGINALNFGQKIPEYINIGDTSLINKRKEINIDKSPFGTLKDYVPFYFCPRSPMLLTIKSNPQKYKHPQSDIIYIVSSIEKIEQKKLKYVFSDGHAYVEFTKFYNQREDLLYLDWETLESTAWFNTKLDPDRRRRKQSEFLVYQSLPLECLEGIATYDEIALNHVKMVLSNHDKELYNTIKKEWYY